MHLKPCYRGGTQFKIIRWLDNTLCFPLHHRTVRTHSGLGSRLFSVMVESPPTLTWSSNVTLDHLIAFSFSSLWHLFSIFFLLSFSDQIRSVAQSCLTLRDPMNPSTPGLPVHHQLPEFTQTHVHRVSDAIQPSHPLSSPSPAPNPSQHQGLF